MPSPDAALHHLAAEASTCTACRLCQSRTHVVFADGTPTARVLIVGEGPGGDEDRIGKPFVGKAGQLLDRVLAAVQIQRADTYITNIVKCRPPGNRTPEPDEIQACQRWLQPQLALLKPDVILTLGNTPTQHFLQTRQGITRLRGTWHPHRHANGDAWIVPMFHPAYLLRNDTRAVGGPKSLTWRDIQQVKAYLDGHYQPTAPRPEGTNVNGQEGLFTPGKPRRP